MPLDLKQHLQDEIAKEKQKLTEIDAKIKAKVGPLLNEKSVVQNKVAIIAKLISDFDKANKK